MTYPIVPQHPDPTADPVLTRDQRALAATAVPMFAVPAGEVDPLETVREHAWNAWLSGYTVVPVASVIEWAYPDVPKAA